MVASISARKSVAAAVSYFKHLAQDEYYTGKGETDAEADGDWDGRGAERLALEGLVSKADFEAALNGHDPKTGARLTRIGKAHAPGWDMTFSAPKSVSVMWALSPPAERTVIEAAHRHAVHAATTHLEDHQAFTRRGKGGAIREPVAGLTIARFHHHTSRDLDPQLHTHAFIFNLAPRPDGSWGSLVSRELYKAQKEAGAVYREHLANGLEREGHAVERHGTSFRLAAIPRDIERAFSKRRQAIESAANTYGYSTAKGMELAALRTRQVKRPRERTALFQAWQAEARTLGFDLAGARQQQAQIGAPTRLGPTPGREARARSPARSLPSVQQMLRAIAHASRTSSSMQGVRISLRQKPDERDIEHER
ncbi:MAG: MobF family relaxase [Hyphomonas sp.]|uniref:MobF family relaxase n=1 Tax=Hyphomonas sp. TaxID=87 RepID=UPI003267A63C